jgi:hypothetical protein
MIDHIRAEALRESIRRDASLDPVRVAAFLSTQPCFQNKDFPFVLTPLLILHKRLAEVRPWIEAYVRLLEKIVALYRGNVSVRAFYGLAPAAERLIECEGEPVRSVSICRLDGYLTGDDLSLRLLENNADSPAGTFFTPRLNLIARTLLHSHLEGAKPVLPMDQGQPFPDALLQGYHDAGGTEDKPFTAVLQPKGRANRESHEIAATMNADGWAAAVVDPRELEMTSTGVLYCGRRVELIWNKINAGLWNMLAQETPQIVDTLMKMLQHPRRPVHINSFGARHVAEAKTSLAFVHDPHFAGLFTAEERAVINRLVPWTGKLERGSQVTFEGCSIDLADLLRARQPDLVVKQQYDIRGDGVTVGRSTEAAVWQKNIDANWNTGAVVQRYVPPARYPIILADGGKAVPMNISLDSFVFNGKLAGLGAKASVHDKVNIFQGGSKLPVIVTGNSTS